MSDEHVAAGNEKFLLGRFFCSVCWASRAMSHCIPAPFCTRTVKVLYGIAVAAEVRVLFALLALLTLPLCVVFCGIRSRVLFLFIIISNSRSDMGADACVRCTDSVIPPFMCADIKKLCIS